MADFNVTAYVDTEIEVEVDTDNLAYDLTNTFSDDQVIEFVVLIDEHMGDLEFTKELRDRLNEIIEEHEDD